MQVLNVIMKCQILFFTNISYFRDLTLKLNRENSKVEIVHDIAYPGRLIDGLHLFSSAIWLLLTLKSNLFLIVFEVKLLSTSSDHLSKYDNLKKKIIYFHLFPSAHQIQNQYILLVYLHNYV